MIRKIKVIKKGTPAVIVTHKKQEEKPALPHTESRQMIKNLTPVVNGWVAEYRANKQAQAIEDRRIFEGEQRVI